MTDIEKSIVYYVKAAVTGKRPGGSFLPNNDNDRIIRLSVTLDVAHLVAQGMIICGVYEEGSVQREKLEERVFFALSKVEGQKYQFDEISRIFDKSAIRYIPLKGAIIRDFYPENWMRTGYDIDILVKEEDAIAAEKLLTENHGFTFKERNAHDIELISSRGVKLELHYGLIEDDFSYALNIDEIWERAERGEGYSYALPKDIFYYYHIAHAAKHFERGGCGIKPVIDIYMMIKNGGYHPEEYSELLKKGGIFKFEKTLRKISDIFFEDAQESEEESEIISYLMHSGVFGTLKNEIAIKQLKGGGKSKYAFERFFAPYDKLKYLYPVLEKHRWLLPICQLRRWFRLLLHGQAASSVNKLSQNKNMDEKTLDRVKNILKNTELL